MVAPTLERWVTPKGNTILIRTLPDGELYPHFNGRLRRTASGAP